MNAKQWYQRRSTTSSVSSLSPHQPISLSLMALHLRKLMSESVTEPVSELCDHYCDDSNESFLCPSSCLSFCPEFCKIPESSSYDDYDPPDPAPHKTSLSLIWVVFTAAIAATVLVVAAYSFYVRSKRRRQRGRPHEQPQDPEETLDREFLDQDRGPVVEHHIWYINTVGLQQAVIDSITVCKYKSGEGLVEGTECSVCLSEFQEDETLRLLPKCSHAFHIPCIDTWLRSHTNCPMCRAPIVQTNTSTAQPAAPSVEEAENSGSGSEFAEQGSEAEEEEGELEAENREKDETQPIRRSFSLDSSSASKITVALANALPEDSDGDSNSQLVKSSIGSSTSRGVENQSLLRLMMASSSTQRSSSSIARSLSCSGKLFLSRNSRSRNLTLPL